MTEGIPFLDAEELLLELPPPQPATPNTAAIAPNANAIFNFLPIMTNHLHIDIFTDWKLPYEFLFKLPVFSS